MLDKISILHIDDEIEILDLTRIFLLELNESYEIDFCFEIEEAVEKIKNNSYDVIISDYQLSIDGNGLDLFKIIRNKLKINTPFILFTGRGKEEIEIAAKKLGVNFYIQKSMDPEKVYSELNQSIIKCYNIRNTNFVISTNHII